MNVRRFLKGIGNSKFLYRNVDAVRVKYGSKSSCPVNCGISSSSFSSKVNLDKIPTSTLDFRNTKITHKLKSTPQLLRALMIFKLSQFTWIVRHGRKLMNLSEKIIGSKITFALVKVSAFSHFCAGENKDDIKPLVKKLQQNGVNPIFDYAAEADFSEIAKDDKEISMKEKQEKECDMNAEVFLDCIEAASQFKKGFAAIKLSSLGRPVLFERMSEILWIVRDMFMKFDKKKDKLIDYQEFCESLNELHVDMTEENKKALFDQFDTKKLGKIDYLDWIEYLNLEDLRTRPFFIKSNSENKIRPFLTDEELEEAERMVGRINKIAESAVKNKVRLMIDAEHYKFQSAISHTVVNLQRRFNRDEPLIFHTHQTYLRETLQQVETDIQRAKKEGFWFATKLVRGAYMSQERERAKLMNYSDPIQPDIEHTHKCFDRCIDAIFDNIDVSEVMIASHNENTMKYTVGSMEKRGIPKKDGGVYFGQLLGMADHLTMTLGIEGFQVYKYLPFGPVKEVMPYLFRRAEENHDVLNSKTADIERHLLKKELKRRFTFGYF